MQLVAPGQGWALTIQRLAWTSDNGSTWTDITPPGAQVSRIKAAFFLDRQHGWALMVQPGADGFSSASVVTVYRTVDGGATWQANSFEGPAVDDPGPPVLYGSLRFTDEQSGVFAGIYKTGNLGSAHIYRTTDGGATWSELTLPDDIGFIYTVGFSNAQDGWLAENNRGVQPLYVTHDGGTSWQTQAVPADSFGALPAPPGCQGIGAAYSGPTFFDPKHGVLRARWECGDSDTTLFYGTEDGGVTWKETSARSRVYPDLIDIVTLNTWMQARGNVLSVTRDGGASWTEVTPDWSAAVPIPGTSAGTPFDFLMMDFADSRHGWAILQAESTDLNHELVSTSDGGHTWTALRP